LAEWHLKELDGTLAAYGWKVVANLPGDDHRVSATWAIERGSARFFLDFQGFDEIERLPVERAYGVRVREHGELGLSFGGKASEARPNRKWAKDLAGFIDGIGRLERQIAVDETTKPIRPLPQTGPKSASEALAEDREDRELIRRPRS
jgi:hypothetical protein